MMFFKSLIYSKEWLDVVFANRNKEYGAYQLRQMSGRATYTALLIVLSAVVGICSISFIQKSAPNSKKEVKELEFTVVEIAVDEKLPEEIIQPEEDQNKVQQIAQDISAKDLVKFTEINPTDKSNVKEDVAEERDVLDKKNLLAAINLKGVKGGELITRGMFSTSKKDGASMGRSIGDVDGGSLDENATFERVEVMPEPIGGMAAFVKWVSENYSFPQSAIDENVKGLIQVKFVVEKDGSLSSFEVQRDLGYGTGKQAVQLLQKARKWNPGVQNGIPVRVTFTLPIRLSTL